MRILQEKANTFMLEECKLNNMLKSIKIQSSNNIPSLNKNDKKCKEIHAFMTHCNTGNNNLSTISVLRFARPFLAIRRDDDPGNGPIGPDVFGTGHVGWIVQATTLDRERPVCISIPVNDP